ncbi:MAG TPA: hypothetical protein VIE91_08885 [Methylophilaceae bacterium]
MNKFLLTTLFASGMLAASLTSVAQDQPKMLVYINPNEFSHEILIHTPYYEHWFSQGPQIEALAKEKLGAEFGDVAMCEGYSSANTVVWIRPSMFYNPIIRTYYGKIVAEVYTSNGASLGKFTVEAKHNGQIDVNTAGQINETYSSAMTDLVSQMAASSSIHSALDGPATNNESKLPCSNVALLSNSGFGISGF